MPKKKAKTKEQIYDEQISPLMAQIIEICKANKIANVCTFSLSDPGDEGLCCTSCMTADDFDPPESFREIVNIIYPPSAPTMMVTVRDGDGQISEMHAIHG